MRFISINKAADQIDHSNHTVRKWVESGILPAVVFPSGRKRIRVEDWDRFIQSLPPACPNVEVLEVLESVKTD